MNPTYTIKNFRVFDEQGATFEMAPITILTGCNSSGKSSVTKSLMLLHPLMQQYKQDIQNGTFGTFSGPGFSSHLLDFTRGNHKLGTLEKAVNWNSTNNEFTIACSVYSHAVMNNVVVELVFGKDEDSHNTQTLRALLKKVIMKCEGKIFYKYEYNGVYKDKPYRTGSLNEHAYINIGGWKKELMEGTQWLEIGYALSQISKDIEAEEAGFGYATRFDCSDLESAKAFFEEQYMNYVWFRYEKLKALLPEQVNSFCQKFDLKNLVHKEKGGIDWPKTEFKYDLANNHVFSLGKLMDELNVVSKDKIVDFAESRFMDEKIVREELLKGSQYRQWIHDIFEEYARSDFDSFADYYSHYEDIELESEPVYFGTKGGRARSIGQERIMDLLGSGTANPVDEAGIRYSWLSKQWSDLSDCQKFECMFYCLQGFGGYEDLSSCGGPGISVPNLDVLRDFATIVCAEVIANCDILTEVEFVEIDRSNAQRMYSFKEQGTSFNSILDSYYNLGQTISYPGKAGHNSMRFYEKGEFINKWLQELTGFSNFKIEQAPEGIGYYVMLQVKSLDKKGRWVSLADVGYGTTPLISMLMRIELMICNYLDKQERVTICIEEPESNLHPALQSRLAEVFADAIQYPINVILETHSEYLIRKLQVLVAEKKVQPENVALFYLYSPNIDQRSEEEKDQPQLKHIEIQSDGSLSDNFGSGFFDEASKHFQNLMDL